jgi:hypothetical protein
MLKHFNISSSPILIICALCTSCSARQMDWGCSGLKNQKCNSYQIDFQLIVQRIVKSHPGMLSEPFQFNKIDSISALACTTYKSLAQANSTEEFFFAVSKFLYCLHDGHTSLRWKELFNKESLPFDFGWFHDSLYIVHVYDSLYDSLLYASVLDFNGYSMHRIETIANNYLFSDFGNSAIQRIFSPLLISKRSFLQHSGILGFTDTLQCHYMINGSIGSASVGVHYSFLPQTSLYHARNEITKIATVNKFAIVKEDKTLYLQINDMPIFGRCMFYRKAFIEAQRQNTKYVIVDLRNCNGGWSGWNDELMRYIVKKPRQLHVFEEWKRKGDRNILNGSGYLNVTSAIKDQSFEGKVIVLVGPHTTSSATHIVIAIKDNQLGSIIGEPCGNTSFRYGDMKCLKLPNTSLEFRYSTKIYRRNNHSADDSLKTIEPDFYISETINDFINEHDPVWDCAIKFITKQNTMENKR